MFKFPIPPGTVVSVLVGFVRHYGIATDKWIDGEQAFISSSMRRGCVAEESKTVFSNNKPIRIEGYPGKLSAAVVLMRARALLGETWDLFKKNCEHFWRKAHGLKPQSPQVRGWAAGIGTFAVIFIASRAGGIRA